jgi:hypothetical protein
MSAADPTQEQLIGEIHRQRDELVSAVAHVRSDVHRDLANVRASVKREVPKVVMVAAIAVALVAVGRIELARRHRKLAPVVRLRFGRYALLEHR